jgi:amino acid permease
MNAWDLAMIPTEFNDHEEAFLKQKVGDKDNQNGGGGRGTFMSTVFLLFNSAVGQGILTLPYCMKCAGILPTTIAILFFACVGGLSSVGIVVCQEASNVSDYQYIVKKRLGKTASYVMSTILAIYCLLNCVGALIIVADNIGPVLVHFYGVQDVWWMQRETYILVGGLVVFPFMCFREVTSLQYIAFLGLAATMYIVYVVVQQAIIHPTSVEEYGPVEMVVPSWSMILALPCTCLAFQYQMQVPGIYEELHPSIKNVRTMSLAIFVAKCIIIPMYLATAFAGYYMFRSATPSDILEAPYDQSDISVFVARVFVALVAVLRVPVNHHTARSSIHTLWDAYQQSKPGIENESEAIDTELPPTFFWAEVFTYTTLMVVLALVIRNLAVALDIMAVTGASAVMFFIPGLFFLKGKSYSEFSFGWQAVARGFMVLGAILSVVSTYDTIQDW